MRCAIYTRKSSDERLDAEYSSLDNQRSYCSAYIASQGGNGWVECQTQYDDGGYSGGTLKRPALDQLREDIAAGRIDMVVVYKIDRLSRSLRDFSNLINEFDGQGAAFVSVTQSFDTSTSMGRLMLNVLLSFAQFERELTGERLRDWFAGAAQRGLWKTGGRPMGYNVVDGHLVIHPQEADLIRLMFTRYPGIRSARALARELNAGGHLNHLGKPLRAHFVIRHLANRLYIGDLPRRGGYIPGHHAPIVTEREWQTAQAAMCRAQQTRRATRDAVIGAMLKGIIYGPTGHAMMHSHVRTRTGQRYRYYVSTVISRYGPGSCPAGRLRAAEIEAAVLDLVERLVGLPQTPRTDDERIGLVRRLVTRVDIGVEDMSVALVTGGTLRAPVAGRVEETKRTKGWWRAPTVVAAVNSGRSDIDIAADLGVAPGSVSRIRSMLRREGLR